MKYFFPIHLDGDNRGCEAIAKGTAILLNEPKENLFGWCKDVELDKRLGVDEYVTLLQEPKIPVHVKLYKIILKLFKPNKWDRLCLNYHFQYKNLFKMINSNDIVVSTGGDMMCYGDNQVIYTLNKAKSIGAKSVLWGCSMGEKNLSSRKMEVLKSFDVLYVRETLTEDFFKSLGLKNVVCFPDPAFIIEPEKVELPDCFKSSCGMIGLNISRMVMGDNTLDTSFGEALRITLDYILNNTSQNILLIPHVLWKKQDDRVLCSKVLEYYKQSNRIYILDSTLYNYCQIRYIISQCRMFIGGRTHSVISAYSTCVPTIALGYSIKARGIAKDLELPENLVVDCVHYIEDNFLTSVRYLIENENEIRNHLKNKIPVYRERLKNVSDTIKSML